MAISAADLMVTFKADTKQAEAGMKRMDKGVTSFAKTAGAVAVGILSQKGLQVVAAGFAGAGTAALDFGAQMANVNSIAQLSSDRFQDLQDDVLALTADPRIAQAPATLAAGLYDVYSSGFQGADGLRVLEQAALAATAGVTDTATAARAITAGLNAYGLEASDAQRVSDVLFQTVNEGVITFEQLANNMGNTLPIASSLGISIEELGAAYAQMTLKGVGASQAETQISALMRSALNPTEALTAAITEAGFASAEAAIEQEGMAGFLKIVGDAANGSQEEMFNLLGTQEAMNAATILGADGAKDYVESLDRMKGASKGAGATNKALAKQMESASFQIAKAEQQVLTLATIGFGILAPAIGGAARGMTSLISKGIIPFTRVIGAAFKGNFQFNKLLKDIPQPLRRIAHAVGVVTEGFSDLLSIVRGRIGINRLPGELRQILGGLQAIGSELLQGAAWAANIAIDLVTDFTGWLWDNKGAIWDGIKDLVGWGAGKFSDLISVTIDIAARLGRFALEGATDIWEWVKAQLFGGPTISDQLNPFNGGTSNSNTVDIGAIDVLARAGELVWAEVVDWGEKIAAAIGHINVDFSDWTLIVGPPRQFAWNTDYASADQRADSIKQRLGELTVPDVNWKMILAAPLLVNPVVAAAVVGSTLQGFLVSQVLPIMWVPKVLVPQVLLTGVALLPDMVKTRILSILIGIGDIDFTPNINITPHINVKDPIVSGATKFWDFLKSGAIPLLAGGGPAPPGVDTTASNFEQAISVTVQPPDLTSFNEQISLANDALDQIDGRTATSNLDLNLTLFAGSASAAQEWARDWDASTFTADLDFSTQMAWDSKETAITWGRAFDDRTFTADLDFNIGPAAIEYTNAFAMGTAWANANFTATLYLNTGPAVAAALAAVSFIDSLLPHSLAKRGPLSKPASFDYIADAFRDSMRGLSSAMSGVGGRHRLSPSAMRGGGGAQIGPNFVLHSDDLIRMQRQAERGGNFATNFGSELSKRLGT